MLLSIESCCVITGVLLGKFLFQLLNVPAYAGLLASLFLSPSLLCIEYRVPDESQVTYVKSQVMVT